MQDTRFSVFISSTFEDLREERQAVQDAVLGAGDFPVQMETFPAADENQFDFIKSLIDQCDYYVLIVAGRYGTPGDDGISYTEKEYNYAKSLDLPILVMLREDRGSIPASKTEETDEGKRRLAEFIKEISTGRLRKNWSTTGDLKHAVRDALDHAKATRPGVGWVRGNTAASSTLLLEMNDLRKENEKYRAEIGHLEVELALPPIPSADEAIEIQLLGGVSQTNFITSDVRIKCSWIDAFPIFKSALQWRPSNLHAESDYYVDQFETETSLGAALAAELATFKTDDLYRVSANTVERLMSYYIETGLMTVDGEYPFTEAGLRLARRVRIASSAEGNFSIVDGEFSRRRLSSSNKKADDEIPF